MKKAMLYLILFVHLTSCGPKLTPLQNHQLSKAYSERNFFKLDHLMTDIQFDKTNPDLLLYQATLFNVFNNPEESTRLINILLKKHHDYFNDTIIKDLYSMRCENANRLQDYLSAFNDESLILAKYSHVCDSSEIETRKEDNSIYGNITHVPKMEVKKPIDSRVSISRDMAGLMNVPVIINNDTIDFVFDTGANVSVIVKSLAEKYGIRIQEGKALVGTSTGKTIEGEIGLLDLQLGNIEVKNSVFIVFPDSALSFANGIYKIRGVIGFPIMYAFQEFIIKDDQFLLIPQKSEVSANRNFALDGSFPVIRVTYKNDTLPFHFDSGANITDLTSLFFNTYKNEIVGTCRKEKRTTGGAGGTAESEIYILDSMNLAAGNSECKLDSLRIFTKDLMGGYVKYQYGNLGQDYINKFSEMKINFASMNICFSNKKN
jgi:hypothetical protein